MNNRQNQIYEEYWSYTAAWTDLNGSKFLDCLRLCVNFIDKYEISSYDQKLYDKLQAEVTEKFGFKGKDAALSARKGINQMVKIGFLKPYLGGYVPEAKQYLEAKTNIRRINILSKVVYKYSNFQNSITDPAAGTSNQIKFLLNTLEEVGALDKRALISLMTTDINEYSRGYLVKEELDELYAAATDIDFIERKYNQLDHFLNLLGRLDDLCNHEGVIYFKTDAERLFGDLETKKTVRDPYLQRVYKSELEEESCAYFNTKQPKCMLEGLAHPVLIASHIKPYSHCKSDEKAQFDVNNGLLLSKNTDSLFDLGYMTFDKEGNIIPSKMLDKEMIGYLAQFKLNPAFMNKSRMDYMEYHRQNVFEIRYATGLVKKYVFR